MKKIKEIINKILGKGSDSSSDNSGFTLIELLVVIAVIGVLAAALLIAIDPIEQIRRAQDSGKKQQVAAIGRAVEAYYVNSASGTTASYPPADTTWLTGALAGEFKTVPLGNPTTTCTGGNVSNNFCLKSTATPPSFVVYTTLVNNADRTRAAAAAGTGCTSSTNTFYVYSSALGKAGIVCAEPASNFNGTLY